MSSLRIARCRTPGFQPPAQHFPLSLLSSTNSSLAAMTCMVSSDSRTPVPMLQFGDIGAPLLQSFKEAGM
jgi:hypothetical protein